MMEWIRRGRGGGYNDDESNVYTLANFFPFLFSWTKPCVLFHLRII
jgi:hypothetical protein